MLYSASTPDHDSNFDFSSHIIIVGDSLWRGKQGGQHKYPVFKF